MNADQLDRHPHICPVCHQSGGFPAINRMGGLLTCPHCRSRLVVGFNGHYVRDPFHFKRASSKQLRQQSRPLARILRDSGVARHSSIIKILTSLILVSLTISVASRVNDQTIQGWLQQITKIQASDQSN